MLIIPAIDIKDGKCVRLTQGDFNREVIYEVDPIIVAKRWEKEEAKILHIVDLDGAKEGRPVNFEIISKIIKKINIPLQIGGGIRNEQAIKNYLDSGAHKVVLGTMVMKDMNLLKRILYKFTDKIIISLDTKDGKLVKNGWKKKTKRNYLKSALKFKTLGVKRFIYTDVVKDGTLTEPNFSEIKSLLEAKIPIIASGGISDISDIEALRNFGVKAAIIGKALYEKKFSFKEAQNAC